MMNLIPILKALSNEKRLKIMQWLKEPHKHFSSSDCDLKNDGVCVGFIERKIGLSQSTVSQYLALLHQAGLITMARKGQWTFCKRNDKTIETLIKALKEL
jgi:DNA-binding transcriptional ArsR family regulator